MKIDLPGPASSENLSNLQLHGNPEFQHCFSDDGNPELLLSSEGNPELQLSSDGNPELQLSSDGNSELQFSSDGNPELQLSSDGNPELQLSSDGISGRMKRIDRTTAWRELPSQ